MDTPLLTTKPGSETVATKPGKASRDGQPAGKVDKAPTAKRDRKAAPVTKDAAPATVTDTEPTSEERTVAAEVPEPTAEDSVVRDVPVTVKDTEPTTQEPSVPVSTPEASTPTVTEPKKPTKADLAKAIYDEMVTQPNPDRKDIIARFKTEANLTTTGAQSYYYKFQHDSGRVVAKGPTKMDKAREVFDALTKDGKARKEIISALINDVGLTKAGASTYFQALKKNATKPTE